MEFSLYEISRDCYFIYFIGSGKEKRKNNGIRKGKSESYKGTIANASSTKQATITRRSGILNSLYYKCDQFILCIV